MLLRYSPLFALGAVQLILVLVVPSKGPVVRDAGLLSRSPPPGAAPASAGGEAASTATDATGRAATGSGGTGAGGLRRGAGAGIRPGSAATADLSHCRDGRQFDVLFHAPPCVARWRGGDNGGATGRGVTAKEVTIVRYNRAPNAAADALLASADLGSTDDQEHQFADAAQQFINAHYELYGRTVKLATFDGSCNLSPPAHDCIRAEMRQLVKDTKPAFVIWDTALPSTGFDELSALGVPNAGGWSFAESFSALRRPYHWDAVASGTLMVRHLAEYWCKRLVGRPARYAGDAALAARNRVLGVLSPDDPANVEVMNEFVGLVTGGMCGSRQDKVKTFAFAQDVNRAAEQSRAAIAKMQEDPPATTVACLCGLLAPIFILGAADEQGYHPEHLLGGVGLMDFDAVARLYPASQWRNAFGISSFPEPRSYATNDAARVWNATGHAGEPYHFAWLDWRYYELVANLLQEAGPTLTPATIERGGFAAGCRGGWAETHDPRVDLWCVGPRDYSIGDDVREVYWSGSSLSALDGKAGAYVSLSGGRRYVIGEWPTTEPQLAAVR